MPRPGRGQRHQVWCRAAERYEHFTADALRHPGQRPWIQIHGLSLTTAASLPDYGTLLSRRRLSSARVPASQTRYRPALPMARSTVWSKLSATPLA